MQNIYIFWKIKKLYDIVLLLIIIFEKLIFFKIFFA